MKMNMLYVVAILAAIVVICLPVFYFAKTRLRFGREKVRLPGIGDMPAECWSKLGRAKIFFGHKSVGYNIVNGLEDVINQDGLVKLNIAETSLSSDFEKPVFAHAQVGKNKKPISKIGRFIEIMNDGVGEKVDIALLKFCYVDVTHDVDHRALFNAYKTAISELGQRYPRVRFVHCTVPLRSPRKGLKKKAKGFVKWFLGIPTEVDDNIAREQYNRLIRDTYGQTGCVFDLALAESIGPDGFACYLIRDGQQIPFMVPEYTDDGGHLNERGRKVVARQMLVALCNAAEQIP